MRHIVESTPGMWVYFWNIYIYIYKVSIDQREYGDVYVLSSYFLGEGKIVRIYWALWIDLLE